MTLLQIYLWVTTIFLGWLGLIWKRSDLLNILFKLVFLALAVLGVAIRAMFYTGTLFAKN